jgi:hypothetical protein
MARQTQTLLLKQKRFVNCALMLKHPQQWLDQDDDT